MLSSAAGVIGNHTDLYIANRQLTFANAKSDLDIKIFKVRPRSQPHRVCAGRGTAGNLPTEPAEAQRLLCPAVRTCTRACSQAFLLGVPWHHMIGG